MSRVVPMVYIENNTWELKKAGVNNHNIHGILLKRIIYRRTLTTLFWMVCLIYCKIFPYFFHSSN